MEKGQQKTLQNNERETEERYQGPSIELVSNICGEGRGELAKSQGSKSLHESRWKQQRERRKLSSTTLLFLCIRHTCFQKNYSRYLITYSNISLVIMLRSQKQVSNSQDKIADSSSPVLGGRLS